MSGKAVIRATQVRPPLAGRPESRAQHPLGWSPGGAGRLLGLPSIDSSGRSAADGTQEALPLARSLAPPRAPPLLLLAPQALVAAVALPQMFTKTGQASRVSVAKEIIIGATLGTALGFYWQT